MPDMKPCFGKELAARFGAGTTPIGTDANTARKECYSCPDIERCALIIDIVIKNRHVGGK